MKIFLLMVIGLLCVNPVSAQIVNPSFTDTYSCSNNCYDKCISDWTVSSTDNNCAWAGKHHTGPYCARLWYGGWIAQDVDFTNRDELSFWLDGEGKAIKVYIDGDYITAFSSNGWTEFKIDVSGYVGTKQLKFAPSTYFVFIDDVYLADPLNYIAWTTCPPNTWVKENYSTLVVSVPDTMDFNFYYKVPNGDYVLTPIQKSIFGRYYNIDEEEFYQDYIKTCYHAVYGNYSAKLMIDGIQSSETIRYIPYFDPDIDIPDVIIIPIPDVYVDPPQWNVTIPPKYENVTWLTDYAVFCDGIGSSMNYTAYATVGLLLTPLEMLNSSITTIHEYATDAAGMVRGFEHCSIIIKVAWEVIPPEIQTLFVGAAALGLVIFLYHRRA